MRPLLGNFTKRKSRVLSDEDFMQSVRVGDETVDMMSCNKMWGRECVYEFDPSEIRYVIPSEAGYFVFKNWICNALTNWTCNPF